MIGIKPEYLDALFGRDNVYVAGSTTFRRERQYRDGFEIVTHYGPRGELSFDLQVFSDAVRDAWNLGAEHAS